LQGVWTRGKDLSFKTHFQRMQKRLEIDNITYYTCFFHFELILVDIHMMPGRTFISEDMKVLPGIMQELGYGEDIKFANPPEAGTTYSDYVRTQHLGTASASGLPYEVFSGDIREVSDRTLRVLINEFRRFAEQRQWHTIIPMFCQPVRAWWANVALLAGHIKKKELSDVTMVEWAPHGWAHIHPVQDPQGKQLEVLAGFRSRSSVIGERGEDPDAVDEERAEDEEREERLGIKKSMPQPPGSQTEKPEEEDQDDANDSQPQAGKNNARKNNRN
jgi:capsid protein